MWRRFRRDDGSYFLEIALVFPVVIILFFALAQLGFREYERMVLSRALTEATFNAANSQDPGAVRTLFNERMNDAWASSGSLGTAGVDISTSIIWVSSSSAILRSDLVYEMPSLVPIPEDAGWLASEIRISSEQPMDF